MTRRKKLIGYGVFYGLFAPVALFGVLWLFVGVIANVKS